VILSNTGKALPSGWPFDTLQLLQKNIILESFVMKTLIVEDDFISRVLLQKLLTPYGPCHLAANGREGLEAFTLALMEGKPYDLICLDIMMPEMDGQEVLKNLRRLEKEEGVQADHQTRVFMTTAVDSMDHVMKAYYRGGCTTYLVKPIDKGRLLDALREYKLLL
jgi:two-component system, chemotaxis family, chemotaxis protein CheY